MPVGGATAFGHRALFQPTNSTPPDARIGVDKKTKTGGINPPSDRVRLRVVRSRAPVVMTKSDFFFFFHLQLPSKPLRRRGYQGYHLTASAPFVMFF